MNSLNLSNPEYLKNLQTTCLENQNVRNTLTNLRKTNYHCRSNLKEDEIYTSKEEDIMAKIQRLTNINRGINEVNLDLMDGS